MDKGCPDIYEKIARFNITKNVAITKFLNIEASEEKVYLQQFSDFVKRLLQSQVLTEFEINYLYWTIYIKYKNKLKMKRFIDEYKLITRSWVGCQKLGATNNYLSMSYLYMTRDGRMKGKGTGSGGPFTLEAKRKGRKIRILLKNVENSGSWDLEAFMQEDNHRIVCDTDYWYVLPEGCTGM